MKHRLPAFLRKFFLQKKITDFAGIAIYPETVRVVKLSKDEEGVASILVKQYPLDKPEALGSVISLLIDDSELKNTSSIIVIPSDKVQSGQIDVSELPEVDIQTSLPWKVKDIISIPPQDMVCDFITMDIQPTGQAAKAQVIATSRHYLEHILTPIHEANIPVTKITTEQLVIAAMQTTKDAAQLLFIQHANTPAILLIVKNKQVLFARKIRGADGIVNMSAAEITDIGSDMVSIEIQRSIDYYESQLKQPPIKDVLIAVAGLNEELLAEQLSMTLPVKTKVIPYKNVQDQTDSISLDFLSAYGAALHAQQEEEGE